MKTKLEIQALVTDEQFIAQTVAIIKSIYPDNELCRPSNPPPDMNTIADILKLFANMTCTCGHPDCQKNAMRNKFFAYTDDLFSYDHSAADSEALSWLQTSPFSEPMRHCLAVTWADRREPCIAIMSDQTPHQRFANFLQIFLDLSGNAPKI